MEAWSLCRQFNETIISKGYDYNNLAGESPYRLAPYSSDYFNSGGITARQQNMSGGILEY